MHAHAPSILIQRGHQRMQGDLAVSVHQVVSDAGDEPSALPGLPRCLVQRLQELFEAQKLGGALRRRLEEVHGLHVKRPLDHDAVDVPARDADAPEALLGVVGHSQQVRVRRLGMRAMQAVIQSPKALAKRHVLLAAQLLLAPEDQQAMLLDVALHLCLQCIIREDIPQIEALHDAKAESITQGFDHVRGTSSCRRQGRGQALAAQADA
mmetsp:Transcript_8708/g.32818  ORF Transcript_8708/g.32818 Transcript_8708/m.32818 type:complete len:209 (-) Transcript_8708:12-638(-)